VVRMMATLVGRAGFRAGMDLYFSRHDGQAVTCDDFAQAIADANPDSALAQHLDGFKRWYAQAGTPTLVARGEYDPATLHYTLTLSQSARPSPGQASKLPSVMPVLMGLLDASSGQPLPLRLVGEPQATGTERLLVLTEAEQCFTFVNMAGAPVPSLLRGLSSPAHLDDGLNDQALLTLLQFDTDAFNRWEAGQRLSLGRLIAALPGTDDLPPLDGAYLAAMRRVLLDATLDPAFKDLMLTLPSESYLAEHCSAVDPQRIHRLREQMRAQLALQLHDDWVWAFEAHQVAEGYRPNAAQSGRRALANLALQMLVLDAGRSGDVTWPGRAYQRFKDAGPMTERFGALVALVDGHSTLAAPALERFHALFAGDDLVIDKWFNLQARALEPLSAGNGANPGTDSVLARVKALMQHPDFSLKNPNRARSLLAGFCRENPAAFHRSDAAGYVFWADRVLELDAINPQLAARLARSMDRWSVLAEPWRSAAREAIVRVAVSAKLSEDLREIVTKSLELTP
jgi:aminopeptidase N